MLGVSIAGGVLFGTLAVVLGVRARRQPGGSAGTAVSGIVLGVLGLLIAAGTWLYIRDDVAEYQGCRKESLSIAQDEQCLRQLRQDLGAE